MRSFMIPGFGDTPKYWASQIESLFSETVMLDWPGLWGSSEPSDNPLERMLSSLEALLREKPGVLIAHSLGTRVALEASERFKVEGLVLIAPALGELSFMSEESLRSWEACGFRATHRPDFITGEDRVLEIPFSYAQAIKSFPMPKAPDVPLLVITMSEDHRQNGCTRELIDRGEILTVKGPHGWWKSPESSAEIKEAIHSWLIAL